MKVPKTILLLTLGAATVDAQEVAAPFGARAVNATALWEKPDLGIRGNKTVDIIQTGDSFIVFGYAQGYSDKGFFRAAYKSSTGYIWDSDSKIVAAPEDLRLARDQDALFCSRDEALRLANRVSLNQRANKHLYDSLNKEQLIAARKRDLEHQRKTDSIKAAEAIAQAKADSVEKEKNIQTIAWFKKKFSPYGIVVSEWNWNYANEYSSAASVYVRVINPTNKRIRYVYFSFSAFDAVDGKLLSRGRTIETVKGIGPVEIDGVAEWNFGYVFWSRVIATLKITAIRVVYFDGTTKVISKPKDIILDID